MRCTNCSRSSDCDLDEVWWCIRFTMPSRHRMYLNRSIEVNVSKCPCTCETRPNWVYIGKQGATHTSHLRMQLIWSGLIESRIIVLFHFPPALQHISKHVNVSENSSIAIIWFTIKIENFPIFESRISASFVECPKKQNEWNVHFYSSMVPIELVVVFCVCNVHIILTCCHSGTNNIYGAHIVKVVTADRSEA